MNKMKLIFASCLFAVSFAYAGGGRAKISKKNVFLVYPSALIYDDGKVLPGPESGGVPRPLLQERGYAVIQPGGAPFLRLGVQQYRSLNAGGGRYAYIDTLDTLEDGIIATNGEEAYLAGEQRFQWLVAPAEDQHELQDFGFGPDRVILYTLNEGETRGEAIERTFRRFIRDRSALRPSMQETWDTFFDTLPSRLEQAPIGLTIDAERFTGVHTMVAAPQWVYEPIRLMLVHRRDGEPAEITPVDLQRYLAHIRSFMEHLSNFPRLLEFWNAHIHFWSKYLKLYKTLLDANTQERALQLFTETIRQAAVALIEGLGQLQEEHGLENFQDRVFERTNPLMGAMGWRAFMDRPLCLDNRLWGNVESVDSLVVHQNQTDMQAEQGVHEIIHVVRPLPVGTQEGCL